VLHLLLGAHLLLLGLLFFRIIATAAALKKEERVKGH